MACRVRIEVHGLWGKDLGLGFGLWVKGWGLGLGLWSGH